MRHSTEDNIAPSVTVNAAPLYLSPDPLLEPAPSSAHSQPPAAQSPPPAANSPPPRPPTPRRSTPRPIRANVRLSNQYIFYIWSIRN